MPLTSQPLITLFASPVTPGVNGARDLPEIGVIGNAHLARSTQVTAVAMSGNKPKEFHECFMFLLRPDRDPAD